MDFRDMYKHTEKVDFNEVHTPTKKGQQSLNEMGEPKMMITAKDSDSVTFLIGEKRYIYKGLSPALIEKLETMLSKHKAGFNALHWLHTVVPANERFKIIDGREVPIGESIVNEDHTTMPDAELLEWYKKEKASGKNPELLAILAEQIKVRGLKLEEKMDSMPDPSFGSKVRAAGLPKKAQSLKDVADDMNKKEVEDLEKSWNADNSKVPNESKIDEKRVKCPVCNGKGYNPKKPGTSCPRCKGEGKIKEKDMNPDDWMSKERKKDSGFDHSGGRYTAESKVNEDDFLNGGATTANDKGALTAAPDTANPPTDPKEDDESTKDAVSDDTGKEEKEESKEGEKEYLGNNGAEQYFYLYKKPAEGVDESKKDPYKDKHMDPSDGSWKFCPNCEGRAQTGEIKCATCKNTGVVPKGKKFKAVKENATHVPLVMLERVMRLVEEYTTSSDTSGQPANAEAAKGDIKDSEAHEKSQTGLGQLSEDLTDHSNEEDEIEDLQILDAEDEVVYSAKKKDIDVNDIKKFLMDAFKELAIANVSYDIVLDYLLPEDENGPITKGPESEDYPYAQGEPELAKAKESIAEGTTPSSTDPQEQGGSKSFWKLGDEEMDEALMKKFGLVESNPKTNAGTSSEEDEGSDSKPDIVVDEGQYICTQHEPMDPYTDDSDDSMHESLLLKYGFMSESTAKLFEKFGLIIDEANGVNETEDLSTPSINGVPSTGDIDPHKDKPVNTMPDKGPGMVETPGQHMSLTGESKARDTRVANLQRIEEELKSCTDESRREQLKLMALEINNELKRMPESKKLNEDGEILPDPTETIPSGTEVPGPTDDPAAATPMPNDGSVADENDPEQELAADYSTPEAARQQIMIDYPEEPLTTTAMVFADSFINDPAVYKDIRKMTWEGLYTDADGIIAQSKIVGDYRNFSPEVVKLLTERLGNGAKYKLGRQNGPTITMVLRDPDFSISLSGLKELVQAAEVTKTGQPGEVILKF